MLRIQDVLHGVPVVPVVVLHTQEETRTTISALEAGDIPVAEITFRTDYALHAIRYAAEAFPSMQIGAGTVINAAQASAAIQYGARFIVSPGLSTEVASVCAQAGIPYLPGCVTPTEIMQALSLGLDTVKFFPADIYGGLKALRALSAPFPQIRFLPTGGIDLSNIKDYLAFDRVVAVGGSFLTKSDTDIAKNCRRLWEVLS